MVNSRWRIILRVGLALLLVFSLRGFVQAEGSGSSDPLVRTQEILSKDFVVDRKYRSMEGPMDQGSFYLLKTQTPELLWIVGYSATPVDPGDQKPLS